MLNFCDFIQVFVFTTNHHLNATCVFNNRDEKYDVIYIQFDVTVRSLPGEVLLYTESSPRPK